MTTPVIQEEPVLQQLQLFRTDVEQEFHAILTWWMTHTVDEQYGGFYGSIDHHNVVDILAPKGIVLNSRILWTFSAAWNQTHQQQYLTIATRAYEYIVTHFIDEEMGGVYWTVDHAGHPFDVDKKIYAQAFTLYAFCEYYKATRRDSVKDRAIELYNLIERYSYDREREGYIESFDRSWNTLNDLRLSAKDANEKKSMNTHLHVLEAYTNLYRIWPEDGLRRQITRLIHNFLKHIIHPITYHQVLFFDEDWHARSTVVSFGHDIETSWLLAEAAHIISDGELMIRVKKISVQMAYAAGRGVDFDGGMWYEQDSATNLWVKEKHWWPQAEALVGFFNAWQTSGDRSFLDRTFASWEFIRENIIDREFGEWRWGVLNEANSCDRTVMSWEDKAGLWKCPYHNGRACMELLKRIDTILKK
ncbi:AGE family epimerase/isomerase [Paraflavitalea sp. CAU 1676]|uniref:AGE family epimerase/isomerase n=1 Tax=Paraflavitalea sp. CAU 1676 TaxID=3032598 RepID=UPI0023DB4A03|nr:AGE family epimerase/isomerase [Paraflavitalea sp. CAU 1676]MDF2188840.1 AGE family epimerase/isomerase [Paraflavitalea sp. CAU 1676]